MPERRKEERIYEEDKVVLSVVPNGGIHADSPSFFSLTQNVSAGGFQILTDVPLEIGAKVAVEIGLSRKRRLISGVARVRWVKRLYEDGLFIMGFEFVEMPPESIAMILEHVYKP
jgi:c-di-GMP-binding flagellar brake protein YcgR